MYKRVVPPLMLLLLLAFIIVGSSCRAGQQVSQSMQEFYAQGNLTVLVCNRPDLDGCVFLPTVNVSGGPVKINTDQLPPEIGDNNVRSLSVVCGRPTAVIAYQHCNYRGNLEAFHCQPGQALEIRNMRSVTGDVSSLVFSDETQTQDLQHTAIPFEQSAIDALHQGIDAGLEGRSAPSSPTTNNCQVIPQCCLPPNGGPASGGGDIEETFPVATEVYWSEPINVFPELPQYGETLSRIDPCPIAATSDRQQLLVVAHHTEINPDGWLFNYRTSLYWYFEPVADRGKTLLRLRRFAVLAEDGWIHDSIVSAIGSNMPEAGRALACEVLSEVKRQGDARIVGAGAAVLEDNTRITWTFSDPVLCNGRKRIGLACGNYVAAPPTLILHKR